MSCAVCRVCGGGHARLCTGAHSLQTPTTPRIVTWLAPKDARPVSTAGGGGRQVHPRRQPRFLTANAPRRRSAQRLAAQTHRRVSSVRRTVMRVSRHKHIENVHHNRLHTFTILDSLFSLLFFSSFPLFLHSFVHSSIFISSVLSVHCAECPNILVMRFVVEAVQNESKDRNLVSYLHFSFNKQARAK